MMSFMGSGIPSHRTDPSTARGRIQQHARSTEATSSPSHDDRSGKSLSTSKRDWGVDNPYGEQRVLSE